MNKQLNYKREKNRERFAHMQMKEIWEEQVMPELFEFENKKERERVRAMNDEEWAGIEWWKMGESAGQWNKKRGERLHSRQQQQIKVC